MTILTLVLMLDPSRLVAPPAPPAPAWCAKLDDLKRIEFGPVRPIVSTHFDPLTLKVRDLRDFDRL